MVSLPTCLTVHVRGIIEEIKGMMQSKGGLACTDTYSVIGQSKTDINLLLSEPDSTYTEKETFAVSLEYEEEEEEPDQDEILKELERETNKPIFKESSKESEKSLYRKLSKSKKVQEAQKLMNDLFAEMKTT